VTDRKLNRSKTSEAVAEYLLGEFVAGRLRPGDRIDPNAVADELGVSRAPVREALILLERDGTVSMPYHRGSFMGDIDAAVIREGFTLYALLSGLTAQRATASRDKAMIAAAEPAAAKATASRIAMEFDLYAQEFRRIINVHGAGPHLRAMLRTFRGLVHAVSLIAIEEDLAEECELLDAEMAALRSGDAKAATEAAIKHVLRTGERGIAVLVERGVVEPETPPAKQQRASLAALVEAVASGGVA
jgi:DNA-binding GntR family transcriptional regulator